MGKLVAKVTLEGQVTIPAEVRRALHIETGDDLVFEMTPEGARVLVRKRPRLADRYASLPATRPYPGKGRVRTETGRALGKQRHGPPPEE